MRIWQGKLRSMSILPNPSVGPTQVVLDQAASENLAMQVIGIDGKVWREDIFSQGTQQLTLQLSDLPRGIYFIKLTGKGVLLVDRLMKGI